MNCATYETLQEIVELKCIKIKNIKIIQHITPKRNIYGNVPSYIQY